jgi:hypothetical protein
MQILTLHINGLSTLPKLDWHHLSQSTVFKGPNPRTSALRDALELTFAALNAERIKSVLERWGWAPQDVVESNGRVEECHWSNSELARLFVVEQPKPILRVDIELSIDADTLANLRRWSVRDPAIQTALLESPTLTFSTTFEFGMKRQFMRINVGRLMVGDHRIDHVSEPPPWLPMLWAGLSRAFVVAPESDDIAALAAEAAFSVASHERYREFCDALPRFAPLRLVQLGNQWQFFAAEHPIRVWGASARLSLRHAAMLYLSGASMVWLEGPCACELHNGVQAWGTTDSSEPLAVDSEENRLLTFSKS